MSNSAQTMIVIAMVPAMIAYAAHEVRAAIANLRDAAAMPALAQGVDFRILAENAVTPEILAEPIAPALPEQWRIAA